jgi:nucleoside 2-deoxyribosyltransferase
MKIYIICPVRNATPNNKLIIDDYVKDLEKQGYQVFYPPRDAPQSDPTGYNIVMTELNAIKECDIVHMFWDINSKGSHFDLGMAIALNKPLYVVKEMVPDGPEKSYIKVIREYNANRSN